MNVEFATKVPVKPACYDSVPVCLCKDCQMYDVRMSTRMPIVRRSKARSTSASNVSIKPVCYDSVPGCVCKACQMYEFSLATVRCSKAQSTCGLASIGVSSDRPVPVAVKSSSVAAASSPVRPRPFGSSADSFSASRVSSKSAFSSPRSSPFAIPSKPRMSAGPFRPHVAASSPPRPIRSAAVSPVLRPFWPRVPVVCFVLVVVPVWLRTPFGFVLSFMPVVR